MVAFCYVQVRGRVHCVYTYVVYHTHCLCGLPVSSWYTTLEKNAPVSCMDLFSNPGRWRHICQSGCEDRIYCLMASTQDGDCEEDGTQGRPTLPEGTFAAARKEEGAPRVATGGRRRKKNGAGGRQSLISQKRFKHDAYGTGLKCRWFSPLNWLSLLGNIGLNFTHRPKLTHCKVPLPLVTVANLDKQYFLA